MPHIMPRSQLSQRYNTDLLLENEIFDAEFCRLFWNPFAEDDDQPFKPSFRRKRKRCRADVKHRCTLCPAVFRWPNELEYHRAYRHLGEQLNVCPVTTCSLNFEFPYQLTRHQRTAGHHNWKVVCKECNKQFGCRRFLGRHTISSCDRHKLKHANTDEHYDDNVAT